MWLQFLSYGSIGVGLAVAVLAARLFHAQNIIGGTRLMAFGLALVVIGAGLEVTRAWQAYYTNQRLISATENLPDSFFQDFLNYRTGLAVHLAEPTDEYFYDSVGEDGTASIKVRLKQNECKYFFAAAKPPARVQVTVKDTEIDESGVGYHGYYEVGKICNSKALLKDIEIELRLKDSGGQFQIATYKAPPLVDTEAAMPRPPTTGQGSIPPTAPPAVPPARVSVRHVVCTGEYEQNCAGPHDIFRTCDPPGDQQIANEICAPRPARTLRLNTKGGNHCGYSLFEVYCD
jgi:hypothetical protein